MLAVSVPVGLRASYSAVAPASVSSVPVPASQVRVKDLGLAYYTIFPVQGKGNTSARFPSLPFPDRSPFGG